MTADRRQGLRLAGGTAAGFGALCLGTGVSGQLSGGWLALAAIIAAGGLLMLSGFKAWRGRFAWGYGAGALVFLSCIYLAYRFLATEEFFPSGVLLLVGFLALFLVLLGFFLALAASAGRE